MVFHHIKDEWEFIANTKNIGEFLLESSMIIMENCGGASGPIWGSAFRSAAKNIGDKNQITLKEFADMMSESLVGIQTTGEYSFGRGAVVGDKTLVDALAPFAETLVSKSNDDIKTAFEEAAKSAVVGSDKTKEIVARMGRAGTVGERSLGHPDAGAHALGVIFTEIFKSLNFKIKVVERGINNG